MNLNESTKKVAILLPIRPKQLDFTFKLVQIEAKDFFAKGLLFTYDDFSEVFTKYEKYKETFYPGYFLLDEDRFITCKTFDPSWDGVNSLLDMVPKRLKSTDKYVAEKTDFYIIDENNGEYWTLE